MTIEDILFDNIPEHIWLGDRNTITQRRRDLAKRLHEALDEAGVCLDVLEPFRTADRSADACTSDDPTNHQGDTCPVHEGGTLHPYETPEGGHEPAATD